LIVGGDWAESPLSTGDLNHDGHADLMVGDLDTMGIGNTYVLFGPLGDGEAKLADLASLTFTDAGSPGPTSLGISVSATGDHDGDSHPDVLIGGNTYDYRGGPGGGAYLWYTPLPSGSYDLTTPDVTFLGEESAGGGVASAGDVNSDGIDDIVIGADWADDLMGALENAGGAYFLFGGALPPVVSLATDADTRVIGTQYQEHVGEAVSTAGDWNGDGFEDYVMSSMVRGVHLFYGPGPGPSGDASAAPLTWATTSATDLDPLGDIDGDGCDDVLVGTGFASGAVIVRGQLGGL
jgi:hypothetical protein